LLFKYVVPVVPALPASPDDYDAGMDFVSSTRVLGLTLAIAVEL
jgi:hypothetical protein